MTENIIGCSRKQILGKQQYYVSSETATLFYVRIILYIQNKR